MMKKSLTTLLLVFLIAGFAQAQLSTISGKVTLDAQPMADFGIWVSSPDTTGEFPIWTDMNGNYYMPAFPGFTYTLSTIDTFLYNPLSFDTLITDWNQYITHDFVLTERQQDADVSGIVSAEDGSDVTGMTVYFKKLPDEIDILDFREYETHFEVPNIATRWASYHANVDEEGKFNLGMLYGNYVVYMESSETTLAYWDVFEVKEDMTIDPIILKEKKLLSGTVFNADKYDYVQILAHSLNSGRPYTAVPYMETGEYTMEVAQGDYILRCQAFFEDAEGNNYMYMVFYDGVYHVEDADIVHVEADVYNKDFNLPDTVLNLYSVSGTVTSTTEGNPPIAGATVSFVSCNLYSNLWQWHTATTDDKGDYTMYGKTILLEDSLIGFAFADNFFGEFYKDAATHINATPIVVHPNDEITGKDFSLEPIDTTDAYSISGMLYDEDGNIIPQGQVTAFTTATNVGVISTQVDTNGIYDFGTIFPSGSTVYLQAWGGYGYKVEIYENAECWDDENVKPIEIDSSNVTIDFELEKTGPARFPLAQIRGMVNPGTGQGLAKAGEVNPLEGAVIYVKPQGANEWTNVSYIDNNGNFNLGVDDAVSTYQIMVTARGYETYTDSNVQSSDILSILLQPTAIGDTPSDPVINSYKLFRAYPNPFNPTTTIRVEMAKTADASLVIYNVMGQKVKTLHSGSLEKGTKNFKWNGTDNAGKQVASGLYFYQLKTQNNMQTKSVIFLK